MILRYAIGTKSPVTYRKSTIFVEKTTGKIDSLRPEKKSNGDSVSRIFLPG